MVQCRGMAIPTSHYHAVLIHIIIYDPHHHLRLYEHPAFSLFIVSLSRPLTPLCPRVLQTEKSYLIHADLPGCKKEDVKVTFTDGVLEIAAERRQEHRREEAAAPASAEPTQAEGEAAGAKPPAEREGMKVKYYASEVTYGSLLRSFRCVRDS